MADHHHQAAPQSQQSLLRLVDSDPFADMLEIDVIFARYGFRATRPRPKLTVIKGAPDGQPTD